MPCRGLFGRRHHPGWIVERQHDQGAILLGGRPQLVQGGSGGHHIWMVTEVGVGVAAPAQQSCLQCLQPGKGLLPVGPTRVRPGTELRFQRGDLAVQQSDLVGETGRIDVRRPSASR